MGKTAIILGASGLIGSELLKILIKSTEYDSIKIFVRKSLNINNQKVEEIITDFSDQERLIDEIDAEAIFSCLGSTKKKTPDLKDYKKVDHDIPLFFAKTAVEKELKSFHLVSSIGANSKSSNFYTKLKGEIEDDLKLIGLSSLHIYQPSFLEGNRKEKRIAEKIATSAFKLLNPILIGSLKKYRSIKATDVALAMYNQSVTELKGIHTYTTDKIKELAWVH